MMRKMSEKFNDWICFEDDEGTLRRVYCQILENNKLLTTILLTSGKTITISNQKVVKIKWGLK